MSVLIVAYKEGRRATARLLCSQTVACNINMWPGLWNSSRALSQNFESTKNPLKKPKTPQGKFDESEKTAAEKDPLGKFPDDINPLTKEKGGPRGPEPTRYGDWERKGRCIDF